MAYRSRLARKQSEKIKRRAVLYIFLTLALALVLLFVGIPLLIRLAVFVGNIRGSGNLPESSDQIPPSPPKIMAPFEATNSAQFTLRGFAENGSTVKLYNSSLPSGEVLADNEGVFTVERFTLTEGRNEITAVAVDEAGNESQPSRTVVINFDGQPPTLEITEPQDGQEISQESEIGIRGQTEEGVKVFLNGRMLIVSPEGTFNYPYNLQEGSNTLSFVARDEAGNQTEKSITVNFLP